MLNIKLSSPLNHLSLTSIRPLSLYHLVNEFDLAGREFDIFETPRR